MPHICILRKSAPTSKLSLLYLPHPRTGAATAFGLDESGDRVDLLELQRVDSANTRSWLCGNSVIQDGSFFMASPFDPLFLILPTLAKLRNKTADSDGVFSSLDDILHDPDFPSLSRLSPCKWEALSAICDTKVAGANVTFFRLNDDKTLQWLQSKVKVLQDKTQDSAIFDSARRDEHGFSADEAAEKRTKLILRIVSSCLNKEWEDKLTISYAFSDQPQPGEGGKLHYFDETRAPTSIRPEASFGSKNSKDDNKKRGAPFGSAQESKKKKTTTTSVGVKSLAKVNTTKIRKIDSMFTKQPKN
ncbi:hypothetical protein SeMB42_g00132 [Synchytrium endobioticum]|uniref:Ribonuclease H2 subunit B n=1 Tax=Synchytrium endobioticum TaxID=286115 RepID=A0A507DJ40_9FUNG|nr:hypothetical protein SeLEV6574_g00225 [Synchytrium endobioticum]TPX54866.1 hypothetical protein SeMB42_g00132 [Synchytrium endobioticum]